MKKIVIVGIFLIMSERRREKDNERVYIAELLSSKKNIRKWSVYLAKSFMG